MSVDITYRAWTSEHIFVGLMPIGCPTCGVDRGLCLTTAGDSRPVTGSCPNGHVWDENRVTGREVSQTALQLDWNQNT
jgi:hypothetical protein